MAQIWDDSAVNYCNLFSEQPNGNTAGLHQQHFMDNISIENHTIQTVSVLDPWECFRHCAKHCDCVAFQVSEKICELLGTDIDGAIGNQVKKPGTRFYHMQQNGVRVSLCYCRAFFD